MKLGYLSQYFNGVAAKFLSAVETVSHRSNQHEFNGVASLKALFGEPQDKDSYKTKFIYLTDTDYDPIVEDGSMTWYDARKRHIKRTEYRLYFVGNQVIQLASEGDLLIIAKLKDETLLAIVAEKDTTISKQIMWLFGFSDLTHPGFSVRDELETEQDRLEFTSRLVLESIGIFNTDTEESYLDEMLRKFDNKFPKTKVFSEYARATLPDLDLINDPDASLMAWIEREEVLFRTLEKHFVAERLTQGFDDVDTFMQFSLSVQNRRKSRAGLSLENHLEYLLSERDIRFSRTTRTENKSKPDFLFPSGDDYKDPKFPSTQLTMLGVKSTCKDRWRQVLTEADRIPNKHLLTLEAAISTNQTTEMQRQNLQLVLPRRLHESYTDSQRDWLLDLDSFIQLVLDKQSS